MARLGVGIDVVSVGLQADQEELAKELADRYGDAIELEVGAFGYPMGRERSRPRSPRGPDPEVVEIEGLALRLHPERRVFEVDRGQADLVVRNVSTHHIGRFHCGQPLLSVLVDKSGQVVGGPAPAAIAGTGRSIDLDPGGELKIKVLIGTASYRTEFGYLLPPGQYWLRTYLRINEGNPPYATTRTLSPPPLNRSRLSKIGPRSVRAGSRACAELNALLPSIHRSQSEILAVGPPTEPHSTRCSRLDCQQFARVCTSGQRQHRDHSRHHRRRRGPARRRGREALSVGRGGRRLVGGYSYEHS